MASLDDVDRIALDLPEVTVGARYGNQAWSVGGKVFVWDRPFSKADIKRFGDQTPPEGPIIGVSVEDLAEKEAVLDAHHRGVFTISHFDGFAAVLVQLSEVDEATLRELIVVGWLACAPTALAEHYLANRPPD
jgi:hypothetical protein